jgi:hypothetical protein
MKLLFTKTIEELEDYAMSNGFVLSDEPVQLIDFNALKTALSGLRIDRSVSERSCKFILEAWNTFDDISHTINSPLVPIDLFPKEDVDKSYEKIFYGTNLEPVTPAGCGYSPLLVPKELKMIRTLFRAAVKGLSSIVGYEIW